MQLVIYSPRYEKYYNVKDNLWTQCYLKATTFTDRKAIDSYISYLVLVTKVKLSVIDLAEMKGKPNERT